MKEEQLIDKARKLAEHSENWQLKGELASLDALNALEYETLRSCLYDDQAPDAIVHSVKIKVRNRDEIRKRIMRDIEALTKNAEARREAKTMDYLQQVVFDALKKNPDLDESYARSFALGVKNPIDLCGLDYGNLDRVAAELGCSPDDIDAFMMVTKALYNAGKCEHTAKENRAYTAEIDEFVQTLFEEEAKKERGLE